MLIDVRSADEFTAGHKDTAMNIPVNIIMQASIPVPKDHPIELYCRSGSRAKMAQLILKHRGFTNVSLLDGTGAL
jgi:phage shock protein E